MTQANGRVFAVIVNEFGDLGFDGDLIEQCGLGCEEEVAGVFELTNGCLCCTVQEEFYPVMKELIERRDDIDHIIIETSGLALPALVQAFNWPEISTVCTVDAVVTVVDCPAVASGQFAANPQVSMPAKPMRIWIMSLRCKMSSRMGPKPLIGALEKLIWFIWISLLPEGASGKGGRAEVSIIEIKTAKFHPACCSPERGSENTIDESIRIMTTIMMMRMGITIMTMIMMRLTPAYSKSARSTNRHY